MSKIGKSLLGKLMGSNKSCCCNSPIVSFKRITVDGKGVDIAGMDEEFEKCLAAGKTPENVDVDEIYKNLSDLNEIPENNQEKLKLAIPEEYRMYCEKKKK